MRLLAVVLFLHCRLCVNKVATETVPCDTIGGIHTCDDGNCISYYDVCDGKVDCPDGSDEKPYNASSRGFECTVKSTKNKCLLPEELFCDTYSHCFEDECNCGNGQNLQCSPGECIRSNRFCDGQSDCSNGKDEILYSRNKSEGIICPSEFSKHPCILPEAHKCDGRTMCQNGADECFCGKSQINATYDAASHFDETCFRCLDGHGEMFLQHVCNGFFDCPDLSDECLCENPLPTCNQLSQQADCGFKCKQRNTANEQELCINKSQICDGKRDCPFGEDEKYCQFVSTIKGRIGLMYAEDMPEFWCCNSGYPADCLSEGTFTNETNDGCDIFYACPPDPYYLPTLNYSIKCDGLPTCVGAYDECLDCPGKESKLQCKPENQYGFRCPNLDMTVYSSREICNGIAMCNPDDPYNSLDERNCTETRFKCFANIDGENLVSIPLEMVCDCSKDCNDGIDEENCPEYSKFCCNTGNGVSKDLVCNDIEDCQDGSDECQSCIYSPFADDKHLISNVALRALIWIIGILSSVGNVYVLIKSIVCLRSKMENVHGKIMTLHIMALALADLCVGLYLVALAIAETIYSGIYCYEDKSWRSGNSCDAFGILSTFGLEASVFIQTAVTIHRLRAILRPFRRPSVRRSLFIILSCLLSAMLIALIPIIRHLQDYFTSSVRFIKNPLLQRTITRKELSIFGNKMVSYDSLGVSFERILGGKNSMYSWDSLFKLMRHLNDSFVPQYQFGYYSTHGVCLPKLFPTTEDSAWEYSIAVTALNFTLFVIILGCYIALYRASVHTRRNADISADSKRTAKLQKKITRIIATDFCCWISICIIAFVKILGVPVSDVVYAVAAIVFVPINSAINPFLFSNMPDDIYSKLQILIRRKTNGKKLRNESSNSMPRVSPRRTEAIG